MIASWVFWVKLRNLKILTKTIERQLEQQRVHVVGFIQVVMIFCLVLAGAGQPRYGQVLPFFSSPAGLLELGRPELWRATYQLESQSQSWGQNREKSQTCQAQGPGHRDRGYSMTEGAPPSGSAGAGAVATWILDDSERTPPRSSGDWDACVACQTFHCESRTRIV